MQEKKEYYKVEIRKNKKKKKNSERTKHHIASRGMLPRAITQYTISYSKCARDAVAQTAISIYWLSSRIASILLTKKKRIAKFLIAERRTFLQTTMWKK